MTDTAEQDVSDKEGRNPGVKSVKREPDLQSDRDNHFPMAKASAEKFGGIARPTVVKREFQNEETAQEQSSKALAQHQNGKNHPDSVGTKANVTAAGPESVDVDEQTESKELQDSEATHDTGAVKVDHTATAGPTGTKKTSTGAKRKSETSSNDEPRKKPKTSTSVISKKPRQETLEAVKYISHVNDLILRGKGAKSARDVDVKLPSISKAPKDVQPQLRDLEATGLKLAKAVPAKIKAHVKVLGGVCHSFKDLQPWQNTKDGEPMVEDFKWQVQGMKHPLQSHQLLGASIMITIEKDESQVSGLLLDFMGYGKTVQTIATVVSNPAPSKKRKSPKGRVTSGVRTTLVVCPKSAATQWLEEVKNHTAPQLMAILWTKESETSPDHTLAASFLIVTYDQVRLMFKNSKQPSSLLFATVFHRIVLDEAHKIKNRDSVTFKACMSLKSTHKWCLTGTPIVNGAFELWPYLKFIGHPLVKEFPAFKRDYLGGRGGKTFKGKTQYEELNKLLLPISIMRTPGHHFLGVPLVKLPQEHAETHEVSLSDEEQIILESLRSHIHEYILKKSGGGQSNYFCLFEAFTRYRQYSSAPTLLEGPVKGGLWNLDQLQSMRDEAHEAKCAQTPLIDLFERWVSEPQSDHVAPTGDKKMDAAIAMTTATVCTWCGMLPNDPVMAEGCIHLWCMACVEEWKQICAEAKKEWNCRKCKQPLGELKQHDQNPESEQDGNEKQRSRGDDYNEYQPADEGSTFLQKLDVHPEEPIPLGSKMKRILEQILKWQADAPNDKIIVFQQFIGTSRLLGRLLEDHGISYLYFVGQMSNDQRQKARLVFEQEPEVKVLDPWWNGSVEEQAFGRVNRIGQKKQTHCVHFITKGTIDEVMKRLQQKKSKQKSAIVELEAGKGLTAKTLRKLLDEQSKGPGDCGDGDEESDSEDSDTDGQYGDGDDSDDSDYLD
ncbi:hypothetical protein Daus18300_010684 [Diaporthe australafricana]|uniref:Helicase ATP-binding domain-containing protein n=1 Tax=Diaporthe australafricana TaxID=127596 RepID=A0ABR3W9N5_9PEZI